MSRVYLRNNSIIIEYGYQPGDISGEYPIAFNQCDTPGKIVARIYQIAGKAWMTTELLKGFIDKACEANGLPHPYH